VKQLIHDKRLFIRRLFLIILDVILINIASFFALYIRFEFRLSDIPLLYTEAVFSYTAINCILTIVIFALFRLYKSLWKYAGIDELVNILFACVLSGLLQIVGMHYILHINVPRSYYPLSTAFLIAFISASRFSYRYARRLSRKTLMTTTKRIMILGAGEAGNAIIREISMSGYVQGTVICAIDDDKTKTGNYIQGIKIVGDRTHIEEMVVMKLQIFLLQCLQRLD